MAGQSTITTLEITRQKAYIAMMVPHRIFVHEQLIGKVRNGETQAFQVGSGQHTIYVRQSLFVVSNSVSLDCLPEQTIHLEVTQNRSVLQIILAVTGIGLMFLPKRHNLNLERVLR